MYASYAYSSCFNDEITKKIGVAISATESNLNQPIKHNTGSMRTVWYIPTDLRRCLNCYDRQ
jgi:hypothetical protein